MILFLKVQCVALSNPCSIKNVLFSMSERAVFGVQNIELDYGERCKVSLRSLLSASIQPRMDTTKFEGERSTPLVPNWAISTFVHFQAHEHFDFPDVSTCPSFVFIIGHAVKRYSTSPLPVYFFL
jgi:hypothetical protein